MQARHLITPSFSRRMTAGRPARAAVVAALLWGTGPANLAIAQTAFDQQPPAQPSQVHPTLIRPTPVQPTPVQPTPVQLPQSTQTPQTQPAQTLPAPGGSSTEQPAATNGEPAGSAAPDSGTAVPAVAADAHLPRDLTPMGMYLAADIVVKGVMLGLVFASIVSWTIWLAKTLELAAARRQVRSALGELGSATSLAAAVERWRKPGGAVARLLGAAGTELRMSADIGDVEGIKERVASRLERIEADAGRRMARGTNVLATIGATAPFVGLFGTVWGIMNSFIGISKAQTTNLAVVAPGIAEALLATALGLAAAIPAVIIYNLFARSIAGYRALLADAASEILRLVGRDLAREASGSRARHAARTAAE